MSFDSLLDKFEQAYYESFIVEDIPQIIKSATLAGYSKKEREILLDGVISTLHLLFGKSFKKIIEDIDFELMVSEEMKDSNAF